MGEPREPESPRKRQKLVGGISSTKTEDTTNTGDMEGSSSLRGILPVADMQLEKEVEVGITDFVSPDIPGFMGILKKRFDLAVTARITIRPS